MTDRDRWNLRGPVRSCRLERRWCSTCRVGDASPPLDVGDVATVEFAPDGSLLRHAHRNHDGSTWESIYEHDVKGRLIAIRTAGAETAKHERRHEYDDLGRLARVIVTTSNGDRVEESYEYDAQGHKRKTLHVDPESRGTGTMFWGIEGSETGYSAADVASFTTTYNAAGQPVDAVCEDANGNLLSRITLTYDDEGRLIEETQTRVPERALPQEILTQIPEEEAAALNTFLQLVATASSQRHRYDARGRRVETTSSMFGPMGQDRRTMAYNVHGDLIERTDEHQHRGFEIGDDGQLAAVPNEDHTGRSEARFQYEYDDHGNWIAKTVEGRSKPDVEFSVSSTERRTLIYYDITAP